MLETDRAESQITDYQSEWLAGEKLDFIAYHLRVMSNRLDLLERKVEVIGQNTTNTDAFCQQVTAAMQDMRKNPLMRGMVPPMPAPPGRLIN